MVAPWDNFIFITFLIILHYGFFPNFNNVVPSNNFKQLLLLSLLKFFPDTLSNTIFPAKDIIILASEELNYTVSTKGSTHSSYF